jgi:diketogulonate reductase-like aldo/keto reductase
VELYLLHWSGSYPLEETVRGFEDLLAAGKIRSWGVSNLDLAEMKQLAALPGGKACVTNQLLYNLSRRGIEFDLLPWCLKQGISVMAYSPVEQGRILGNKALKQVAQRLGATPAQVALAWVLRRDGVVAIPKAGSVAHVRENRKALDLRLDAEALQALDAAFPPPAEARPLEML